MIRFFAMALFALELGAGFGTASAEVVSTSGNAMEVELRVEVTRSAESVVAHLIVEDDEALVLPLVEREPGVFGIRTELKPLNYRVVFELLGPNPISSDPHSLVELGLDVPTASTVVSSASATTDSETISGDTRQWGWLAVAFSAAALSALAFWVLGGGDDQSSSDTDSSEGSDEVADD